MQLQQVQKGTVKSTSATGVKSNSATDVKSTSATDVKSTSETDEVAKVSSAIVEVAKFAVLGPTGYWVTRDFWNRNSEK